VKLPLAKKSLRSFSFFLTILLISFAVLAIANIFFLSGANAVTIKQCLFSKMTGVVNLNGKPVANVRLVRTINYNKDIVDETVTDENGNFEFPAVFRNNYAGKILPMEFVVSQLIMAHHEGKEYEMWAGVKRKPEENAESRGKPLVVSCELGLEEEHYIRVNGSPVTSLCIWDVEPDPVKNYKFFDDEDEE
jgi:5-hydroxyisourate hydrolase-like protein (transthyretin family)